ncbi:TAXI family TRAP transporter solute-binding subunit [Bacillus massilinigeriensis]|uniref:TAXI family TRAP transporter solute-binding subunit n=1 Tax=Bacillus mediterraneensis TaxID=1805474 RepID=UPI0008F95919|nr:TAXI family TRAP transporter solute-binding subunit [Bacillus mediterraneensis]
MRKKSFLISLILLLSLSMLLAACGGKESKKAGGDGKSGKAEFISILTGGTGGTYFPLGGSFAKVIKDEAGIKADAVTTGASAENIQSLKDGSGEIAFSQTDIASYAKEGKEMFKDNKIDNVKAIGTLYSETIQIVTTEESGIKSVKDLKGKKVSVGAPGSGTVGNAKQILEMYSMSFEDIKKQDLSFDESVEGLQNGTIDAAFVTAGTPTGAVEQLTATEKVVIVPIEADKAEKLIKKYPYYTLDKVPVGVYKLKKEVPTVAVQAMLVTREDLSEETVYEVTKALFENMDKVTHAKAKQIKPENALKGVGIDVHPGAQKYFDEKGIKASK